MASGSDDSTVRLWDAETGSCKCTLTGDSYIFCVSFSPNSNILAAGDSGGNIRLYDPATGEVKSTLRGHKDPVRSVCFSPCGTKIVSGGGAWEVDFGNLDFSIRIWDAETCTQIGSPLNGHPDL
jgi:WD40 repeat protein